MNAGWIDELEADLGASARLRLIANAGGQRRDVPSPARVEGSVLARELGPDIAAWLAERFGGSRVEVPTSTGAARQQASAFLVADILDAGLTHPTRSANDLAQAHGVSRRWVIELRAQLRRDQRRPSPLPLFDGLPADPGEPLHRGRKRR